jgi:hypothetical protein
MVEMQKTQLKIGSPVKILTKTNFMRKRSSPGEASPDNPVARNASQNS